MKTDELKIRILGFLNNMIDTYYGCPTVGEKMLNYTLKIIAKNNIGKLDSALVLLADADGNIDAETMIKDFMCQMGDEKMVFSLQDYVDNPFVKNLLPEKSLVISASDISRILY